MVLRFLLPCLFLFGSAAAGADWPMHHYDPSNIGSSGQNPSAHGFQVWVVKGTHSANQHGGPIVGDGRVFIGGDGMRAYDAATGALLWHIPGHQVLDSAALAGGNLYFTSGRLLFAVEPSSGALLWTHEARGLIETGPVVAKGSAFFGLDEGELVAVDATTGRAQWSVPLDNASGPGYVVATSDTVVLRSPTSIHAVDATSGMPRWAHYERTTEGRGSVNSFPTVWNGTLFVAGMVSPKAALAAFDIERGDLLWTYEGKIESRSAPAAAAGRVFVNCEETVLCAIDAANGNLVWRAPVCAGAPDGPVVAEGIVYVDSRCGGEVYAIDAGSGILQGTFRYGGLWMWNTPAYANGVLYLQYQVFDPNPSIGTGEPVQVWNMTAIPVRVLLPETNPVPTTKPVGGWSGGIVALFLAALLARESSHVRRS